MGCTSLLFVALACTSLGRAQSKYTKAQTVQYSTKLSGWITYRLQVQLIGEAETINSLVGSSKGPLAMPPAFQVPSPLGANTGGVNPASFSIKKEAELDSWLTVGITITASGKGNSLGTAELAQRLEVLAPPASPAGNPPAAERTASFGARVFWSLLSEPSESASCSVSALVPRCAKAPRAAREPAVRPLHPKHPRYLGCCARAIADAQASALTRAGKLSPHSP